MREPKEPLFTLEEIRPALSHLSVEEQDVAIASLRELAERKGEELRNREFNRTMLTFAALYQRVNADDASDSNIEGWSEQLNGEAQHLVHLSARRKGDLSEIEKLARDTAATVHAYFVLEWDEPQIDYGLLQRAGVDADELLGRFKNGVIEAHVEAGQDRDKVAADVAANFRSLEDFSMNLYPSYWKKIIDPQATELRAKLVEARFTLPELNEEGKFGEDDELEVTI